MSSTLHSPTVGHVLAALVRNPWTRLIRNWNWKSAILSSLVRSSLFFVVNLDAGWHAAWRALLTELAYRGLSSGFFGAMTEAFRTATPRWLASCTAMLLLPAVGHSMEWVVHWWRETPHLAASVGASVAFTAFSTLFNLHAMRQGALIVGEGRDSLLQDLKRIPTLLVGFVLAGVQLGARLSGACLSRLRRTTRGAWSPANSAQ